MCVNAADWCFFQHLYTHSLLQLGGGAQIQLFVEKPSPEQLEEMSMDVQEMVDFQNECNLEDDVPFEGDFW